MTGVDTALLRRLGVDVHGSFNLEGRLSCGGLHNLSKDSYASDTKITALELDAPTMYIYT
jgi:hypothetical protein